MKTLYYTKYYSVNKEDLENIIKDIIENEVNQDIFKSKQFKKHLNELKNTYSLKKNEYNYILVLLNIYDKSNDDIFKDLTKIVEKTPEEKMISNSLYGKYILNSKVFEIIISFICIITILIARFDYVSILSIQFVLSFCLLFELYSLIKNLGLNRFIFHHFNRVIFHIFNLVVIICIVYLIEKDGETLYRTKGDNNNSADTDPVKYEQIQGTVVFKIGKIGALLTNLLTGTGITVIFFGLVLCYSYTSKKDDRRLAREEARKRYNFCKYGKDKEDINDTM